MNRAQKRKTKKQKVQEAPQPRVYYVCDPSKNAACKKTSCYINGGPCRHTTNLEFALQPVEHVTLVLPMSKQEAMELGGEVDK